MLLKIPCVSASPSSHPVPSPTHTHTHTERGERERFECYEDPNIHIRISNNED